MKPRITKHGNWYFCESTYLGFTGHLLKAWGYGVTPMKAYQDWLKHRGAVLP